MASLLPYDNETIQDFFAAFLETDLGKRMDREDLLTNANVRTLVKQAQEAAGYEAISVAQFAAVAKVAYLNGDLEPERQPEPEPEPAPKPLTAGQKAWQEFRLYTESHSAKDCEARARVDRHYAAYLHKLRVGEFEASEVGDAVVNLNEKKPEAKSGITAEMRTFADDYRKMSCDQWKSLSSPASAGEYVANHYRALLEKCIAAGLV